MQPTACHQRSCQICGHWWRQWRHSRRGGRLAVAMGVIHVLATHQAMHPEIHKYIHTRTAHANQHTRIDTYASTIRHDTPNNTYTLKKTHESTQTNQWDASALIEHTPTIGTKVTNTSMTKTSFNPMFCLRCESHKFVFD